MLNETVDTLRCRTTIRLPDGAAGDIIVAVIPYPD